MSLIRGKDTRPELIVRRCLHGMGYRYSLHRRDLPGRPDIVLRKHKAVIFVHGCFWHRHGAKSCKLARLPKSRLDFWAKKLEGNRFRDRANQAKLRESGWRLLVVWECQIADLDVLARRLRVFLTG